MTPEDLRAVLGIGSGVVLVAFGAWLLASRAPAVAGATFGAFVASGGALVASSNAIPLVDAPLAARLFAASELISVGHAAFLVAFLVVQSPDVPRARRTRALLVVAAAATVGLALLLVIPPSGDPTPEELRGQPLPGRYRAVNLIVAALPLYAAYGIAIVVLLRRLRTSASPLESRQTVALVGALMLYAGFAVPWFGLRFAATVPAYLASQGAVETVSHGSVYVAGALAIAAAGASLRELKGRLPRGYVRFLLGCYWAPLGVGVASGLAAALGARVVGTLGVWRVLSVLLLAFAVVRHRLFDLTPRGRAVLLAGLGVAVGTSLLLVVEQVGVLLFRASMATSPVVAAAGVGVFVLSGLLPQVPSFRTIVRRATGGLLDAGPETRPQRLSLYHAGLLDRRRRGLPIAAGDPDVARLRAALGLDDCDHGAVALFVADGGESHRARPDRSDGATATGALEPQDA